MSNLLPSFQTRPITVSVTANRPFAIEHGLGRPVAGWVVVDRTAACTVWRSGENGTGKLVLTCNQSCTLSILLL
ncbi:hypothetical protein NX722_23460 [Endozoicomonas gorgoniicola]|uniref:Uncharacterized protein n=1 Tax=Endozoicomonas gorgoniicola TaxID=1234144 RepID=A0ABT3N1M3_9GAMM|nr:hypothetical protein [Endozoicomonas gorgoniicola]MCW7555525.1 hypothetical protein [Endozoicomonas gorgoniicola]